MELPTKARKFGGSIYVLIPHAFVLAQAIKNGDDLIIRDIDKRTIEVRK